MKQYDKIWIPEKAPNILGDMEDATSLLRGPVIVLTIEELREVWKGAVSWLSGLEFGNHSLPNFEQFIESKGINI